MFVFKREAVFEFGSVTHPSQSVMAFGSNGKEDRGRSKRQNNDKAETERGAVPCSRNGWHAPAKANKQLKCLSMHFAYTITYKTEMGIGTKIQSTPGPKHDQINTALIAHHLEVGMKWTLAESSVQFSLSCYVIVGWSNHPFYEWAVLGEMEKITQFMTCPVIIVLHTAERRPAEASGSDAGF